MNTTQGKRLKELMQFFDISQDELGKRLNIPKSSLSMYLSDSRKMRQDRIKLISETFGVNEAWIMGYNVPMRLSEQKPMNEQYYYDSDSAEYAQFLFNNPEYKVLFDASRNVKPEDIEFVKQMMERITKGNT